MQYPSLPPADHAQFRTAVQFLEGRMGERDTIEWALKLATHDLARRAAVKYLLDLPRGRSLPEPWKSAWLLIEESWQGEFETGDLSHLQYGVAQRLKGGERSGALIAEILRLVRPVLRVEPISELAKKYRGAQKRPRAARDLLSVGIHSGDVIDPKKLGVDKVEEIAFLVELGHGLDAAVVKGLDIGRRVGWEDENGLWQLGDLRRVYYVDVRERDKSENEPDEFHRGLAPATKMLFAVVQRLGVLDSKTASSFIARWRYTRTPIHVRLWAAAAMDSKYATAAEVGAFFKQLDAQRFWNLHKFPEIAQLRAKRFGDLSNGDRLAICQRLLDGPPRNHWPKETEAEILSSARRYWSVRELRRIEIAGHTLPGESGAWLEKEKRSFPELAAMRRIDEGFLGSAKAFWVAPTPDLKFDTMTGAARLHGLEAALATGRGFGNDQGKGAADWIAKAGNSGKLILDFELARENVSAKEFPKVWSHFGWHHLAQQTDNTPDDGVKRLEIERVLDLLGELSSETLSSAIDGIAHWLSEATRILHIPSKFQDVWLRVWPEAVRATNAQQPPEEEPSLNVVVRQSDGSEPEDLDTLNTAAGKLVGAFLSLCPNLADDPKPFRKDALRKMRDSIVDIEGRSGLIARHRLIEHLQYFLKADAKWTSAKLIRPLQADSQSSVFLWRAVARQTRPRNVLEIIGSQMVLRVTDTRLGRNTRQSLVFSILVDTLHSLFSGRKPAIPYADTQQMLRSIEDELRGYAADVPVQFVREMAGSGGGKKNPPKAEELFRKAALPFLQQVWPQERSLATPGVARALSELPAVSGEEFAGAVGAIERFLVPFEAWSLIDYGLYGSEGNEPKLLRIDSHSKAKAFVTLLDSTIGSQEGAIFPTELGDALDLIATVSPRLATDPRYLRLKSLARAR